MNEKMNNDQKFNIRLSIPGWVLMGIILPPLLIVTPAIIAFTLCGPALPDWGIYGVIVVCLIGGIIMTKYVVNVLLAAKAVLTVNEDGFHVAFAQKNFYTPASFSIKTSDITNFAYDGQGGRYYMTFDTVAKPAKFQIMHGSYQPRDMAAFKELFGIISAMVEESNNLRNVEGTAITAKTMYEKPWAKILALTVLLALIVLPVLSYFKVGYSNPPWWRFAGMFIIALPFLGGVLFRNSKKKE